MFLNNRTILPSDNILRDIVVEKGKGQGVQAAMLVYLESLALHQSLATMLVMVRLLLATMLVMVLGLVVVSMVLALDWILGAMLMVLGLVLSAMEMEMGLVL